MSLFQVPQVLIEVAHFSIPKVQTWGNTIMTLNTKLQFVKLQICLQLLAMTLNILSFRSTQ